MKNLLDEPLKYIFCFIVVIYDGRYKAWTDHQSIIKHGTLN